MDQNSNETDSARQAAQTKKYVIISLVAMVLLSLYIGWTMSENYRKEDSQTRYRLTQLYKEHKKKEYKFNMPRGHTLYHQMCVKCHSANGQGVEGKYPPLANSQLVKQSFPKTVRIVLHGMKGPITRNGKNYNEEMPSYKKIEPEDMAHVINYIRFSFGNKASAVPTIEVLKAYVDTIERKQPYTQSEIDNIKE